MEFLRVAKVFNLLPRVLILILVTWLVGVSVPCAERIVVLPLADVSQGDNGVNMAFTHEIREMLQGQEDLDILDENQVVQFMVKNRIRFSGYIDSFMARKIGRDLGCDLVLLGTITEMGGIKDPAVGLTLSVMDTNEGIPVWAGTRAMSLSETVRAMGIGQPQTLNDLKKILLEDLFEELNRKLDSRISRAKRPYQLVSLQLSPEYIKGGKLVDCRLKIRFLETPPERIAVETEAGKMYLYPDERSSGYRGYLASRSDEGCYPVSLILEWKDRPTERIPKIAAYNVINEAPRLVMDVKKGLQLGDLIAFRDYLIFFPKLEEPRPLTRWAVEINNEKGDTIIREEKEGNLPSRLVWEGRDAHKRKLDDGFYSFCLNVWDAAGNHAAVTKELALQSTVPPVNIAASYRQGKTYLEIISEEGHSDVPLGSWTLNVASAEGQALISKEGHQLPALIDLQQGLKPDINQMIKSVANSSGSIYCDIEVKDRLGNRFRIRKKEIQLKSQKAVKELEKNTSSWTEDF
ncbi:MAG: hypothetical protein JW786_03285 [Desulfobacterales bacterium]|nr:hypothetical protein [Desulfobacterales bacterium]